MAHSNYDLRGGHGTHLLRPRLELAVDIAGRLIVGLTSIYGPALNAIVADSVPKERRGMAFSIINLIASVSRRQPP